MSDLTTELRRAVLTQLKANASLLAIVPKASIYSGIAPNAPTWPFVKWGVPSGVPIDATCLTGEDIRVTIHAWARARMTGTQIVETGEDHIGRVIGAIKGGLNKRGFDIPSGHVRLRWIAGQRLLDGDESDDWHAVCDFRARVLAE